MANPAVLTQKYGQVIMGYITEAIIKFEEFKAKKQEDRKKLIVPAGFEPIIGKIHNAFGDLEIAGMIEEKNAPVITIRQLNEKVRDYLDKFQIKFDLRIYQKVLSDLANLGILSAWQNYYVVNTEFFSKKELKESCISLRHALETRMKGFLSDHVVREILLVLCESAGLTDEELASIPPNLRRSAFFRNIGRGMLLWKIRSKGITYDPFMRTVDLLVKQDVLIEGCDDTNTEIVMINSVLKPFSVIVEIIESLKFTQKPISIVEIEVSNGAITPFSSMVNMGNLGKDPSDIYLFSDYNFGLQGL